MKKILYFVIVFFISCSGSEKIDFNKSSFPILVSCTEGSSECFNVEPSLLEAIEIHNELLEKSVFEFSESKIGQIDVTTESYILNDDGSINYGASGQTDYNSNPLEITLSRLAFFDNDTSCIIMHELGHALGYHGHYPEEGTLMSESADCETKGWYDDFYDWFQETYQ